MVSSHIESILLDVGMRITVNYKMSWLILFVHACVVKNKKAFKWESVWIVVPRKQYKWFVLFFYCMAITIVSLSEILYTKYPPGGLFLTEILHLCPPIDVTNRCFGTVGMC